MATAGSSSGGGGGGGVPPGFRFHPTDEELLHFYLKKKISFHKFDMDVIREVDLNKIEPWELQERCRIGSTPQNEWYFFSHKDRKYPTGSRTNRATGAGFWKATGRDKCIRNSFSKIGMRKTLVFYRGRAPHGLKTDWIMHEYRLHDDDDEDDHDHSIPAANTSNNNNNNNSSHNNDHPQQPSSDPHPHHHQEDGWVVCRVFKKKNLFKAAGNSSGGGGGHVTTNGNINQCDDHQQLTSSSRSLFTTIRDNNNASIINQYNLLHHPDLNYTITHHDDHHNHHIPLLPPPVHHHQYPHLIEAQNLIISPDQNNQMIKPLMLSTSSTNNDNNNYHHHHHNFLADHQTVMMTSSMQVKQFMSSNTNTREDCESASPTPAAADYQACDQSRNPIADDRGDQNMNEWDRLVVATSHHDQQASNATSSINQINPLSLPSEMDFWAYGK